MEEEKEEIINEININNNIISMGNVFKVCKSTVKIEIKGKGKSSGFFLKCKRGEKPFYSIMTNQHVISSDIIHQCKTIVIKYENETKELNIELNEKERIIICFDESLKLDVTIIEIIKKDNIDEEYFLYPYENKIENSEDFIGQKIQVVQFPGSKDLSLSNGKITGIDPNNYNNFYHNSDTEKGSSGSPIVLDGEDKVIAIHKGSIKNKKKNIGIFIGIIINLIKDYKINGERKEFYENGELKYEGNFLNDEYDGEGKLYNENGEIYMGEFKQGAKNGFGRIIINDYLIKEGVFFNDEFIEGDDFSNEYEDIKDKVKDKKDTDLNYEENKKNVENILGDIIEEKLEAVGDAVGKLKDEAVEKFEENCLIF